jgi:uncharacterized membrane protein
LLGLALCWSAVAALAAPPVYRITEIPIPPEWKRSWPTAINENGDVLGYLGPRGQMSREQHRPFVWSAQGGMTLWPTAIRGHNLYPADLNSAVEVVGSDRQQAFLWTPTAGVNRLVDKRQTFASGINEHGVVTGLLLAGPHDQQQAFLWSRTAGLVSIHPPASAGSLGRAVNNLGLVAGQVQNHEGQVPEASAAVLSRDGEPRLLGCLSLSQAGNCSSIAQALNDAAQVVGTSMGDVPRAFFWSEATGMKDISLDIPSDLASYAVDINSRGQVVGHEGDPDWEAFYWDAENGRHRLSDLIDPADPLRGARLFFPAGINSRGQIAVQVDSNRIFLLTPMP